MGTCDECDRDSVETAPHRIYYVDDRDPRPVDVCAPCVRDLVRNDDSVRAVT